MRVGIQITKVKVIPERPYTLKLSGHMGHSKFMAELVGVNLEIKTSTPLDETQIKELEEQLQDLFPMPFNGPFKQSEIDETMKENMSVILITV